MRCRDGTEASGTRRGLVRPATGWMAVTLFALAAFRSTAPGAPPTGCLWDYAAFLWAEAIVASAVVYVVLRGTPVELRPSPGASRESRNGRPSAA
ncbi:DUF4436 family protein [Streptomyces sp. NPDC006430]|uniref:DUF4436 family protein n=1 Tax=Streptomyces sp. NPDC006430 TaxID=3154299 RepID=UPI0033ABD18B